MQDGLRIENESLGFASLSKQTRWRHSTEAPYGLPLGGAFMMWRVASVALAYGEKRAAVGDGEEEVERGRPLDHFDVKGKNVYTDILRAGIWRPCVLDKRTPNEKFVRAFYPWIRKTLDSNMDLQVILDK
ncbi:hypothetical protein HPB50_020010 [Hyalomma asiaticum]|uniref:Uncharacterized protein n=1 Tax=Hyalomma asiaticum TaxID=266040 RepID=A0ACB7RPQ2_HYAAI|nr:hypothetical protein HPB50_020010 [Hyalomma asiaticum]